ncbi:methyltransferase domain-containing protein [Chromohalobacter nigrandesensis]|uniref:methyltransferase domain-containing protein n=1 Tax=Chromohalobacter nigrandesensis TaxID=119863 RepID=UPI001FF1BB56|nr:methyltransferase domain-containing protein [Chromohalobacter nigrandesensis]MCK0746636.1 methyltransferase domain-containing protein [Chromohalobacter nigrandesensis]
MATNLHQLRLHAVVDNLLASGAQHVVDLGCGHGVLLRWLSEYKQFNRLIGIDNDARAVAYARDRLNLDILRPDKRLHVSLGSFENCDWAETGIDGAVMLETIEHIDPDRLSRVEKAIFGKLGIKFVVITTPNKEYNPLHGMPDDERRHADHRFEWTRAQFQSWCNGVAERHGYQTRFEDVGPRDPVVGSSTQMVCFTRC